MDNTERIAKVQEIVAEQFHGGTQVTNCVLHMSLPLDRRPEDCQLCRTDIVNQLHRAIRINEWLNEHLDRVRVAVGGDVAGGRG